MSRPACSTASPALPIALSTCRPARSAGPPLSAGDSRLQAATMANAKVRATSDFTGYFCRSEKKNLRGAAVVTGLAAGLRGFAANTAASSQQRSVGW